MNFLKRLFLTSEQKNAANIIAVALQTEKLSINEAEILKQDINYIDTSTTDDDFEIPEDRYEKFKVMYTLEEELVKKNKFNSTRAKILEKLFSVYDIEAVRINEIIKYLKFNIQKGNSPEESYLRLSYLLRQPQTGFTK